jgi:hypothetical protein
MCGFCDTVQEENITYYNISKFQKSFVIQNPKWSKNAFLYLIIEDENYYYMEIKYCPQCGKHLL